MWSDGLSIRTFEMAWQEEKEKGLEGGEKAQNPPWDLR